MIGGLIGAAVDYGVQVGANYATGNKNPWTSNISLSSIAASAVEGGVTQGASAVKTLAIKGTIAVIKNSVDLKIQDGELKLETTKTIGATLMNASVDMIADKGIDLMPIGKNAVKSGLSELGFNKGGIASAAKSVYKALGGDVTRAVNNNIKNAAKTAVKEMSVAPSKIVLGTSIEGAKTNLKNLINGYWGVR